MTLWKEQTGKTLSQWAEQYGISREGARQRYKRWGTFEPQFGKKYTSRYTRWQGDTLLNLAKKYNVSSDYITHWYRTQPDMTFEQFQEWRAQTQPENRGKWSSRMGSTIGMPNIKG